MAGNILTKYGPANQAITCTVLGLANNAARGSTAIDNTTNLWPDVLVSGKIKTNAAGTSANGTVNIYVYGSCDDGTTYQESFNGVDGAITLTSPPNVRILAIINAVANSTQYSLPPSSVAMAFGGNLPKYWGIVVENKTGAALDASVGGFYYQGIGGSYT